MNTLNNSASDSSKIVALSVLGIGSFVCGLLPACLSIRISRFPLLTSVFLCFGAGVLLATSLVHMLPEVQKSLESNAELALCGGFFLIYFIDEFVHFIFGETIHHSHTNGETHNHETIVQGYGATNPSENTSLIGNGNSNEHQFSHEHHPSSITGALGLVTALSLHSLIEGLAIGVQTSQSKVYLLLLAVSCHKFVMAFCLGLECCTNSLKSHLISISVFSLGSVAGIVLGMIITDIPAQWQDKGLPILQAFAAGTLLYITVSEVMPREKAKYERSGRGRINGLIQFLAIATGFSFMVVINFYLNDD